MKDVFSDEKDAKPSAAPQGPGESAVYQWGWKYYDRIHILRNAKSRAYVTHDNQSYYRCLHDNYIEILFILTIAEEKWFDDQFAKAERLLFSVAGSSSAQQTIAAKNEQKGLAALYEIDKKIMRAMAAHNMIFPKSDAPLGFDAVRSIYRLQNNGGDMSGQED